MIGMDYNKVPYGKNEGRLWKDLSDDLLIRSYMYLMTRPDILSSNCMIKIDKKQDVSSAKPHMDVHRFC